MKKKTAFTLAEVLVTIGIIGIVSAITMPTLISNHQNKVFATSIQKIYSDINQAITRLMSDKQTENLLEAGLRGQSEVDSFVEKYFKINGKTGNEYIAVTKTDDTKLELGNNTLYNLAGGGNIAFISDNGLIHVFVDTNAGQKPNTIGRDIFVMTINIDGSIVGYTKDTDIGKYFDTLRLNNWRME